MPATSEAPRVDVQKLTEATAALGIARDQIEKLAFNIPEEWSVADHWLLAGFAEGALIDIADIGLLALKLISWANGSYTEDELKLLRAFGGNDD